MTEMWHLLLKLYSCEPCLLMRTRNNGEQCMDKGATLGNRVYWRTSADRPWSNARQSACMPSYDLRCRPHVACVERLVACSGLTGMRCFRARAALEVDIPTPHNTRSSKSLEVLFAEIIELVRGNLVTIDRNLREARAFTLICTQRRCVDV